jgi:hypothetical protein
MGICEIPALVDVAAGDQPQIDSAQHFQEAPACWHWNVADRCSRELRIVGRIQKKRLVQEQRYRLAVAACELRSEPVELLGLAAKPGVHDQGIKPDETPVGSLEPPAVFAENEAVRLLALLRDRLRWRRTDRGRVVANVMIARQVTARDGKCIV